MPVAAYTLARAAFASRNYAEAIGCFAEALSTNELTSAERLSSYVHIGKANEVLGRGPEALAAYRQGLVEDGNNAELLILLGNLYKRARLLGAARECYERVLNENAECMEAIFNLAALAQDSARYMEAITGYRYVLERHPHIAQGWDNLAACMTYDPASTPGAIKEALEGFDTAVAAPLRLYHAWSSPKDPERPLRVGYVSADLRAHPVGYLLLPLLERHNRRNVEIFCYFCHRTRDAWTQRFEGLADHWIEAADLDDAALAARIAQDGIDILVDLAGHSEGNRLPVFARKPAPVQLTWMGYVTTTGMAAMDWRLTCDETDPPGCDGEYTERLWRLPHVPWCFRPLPGMPPVAPAPAQKNGFVTFGVVNRFSKNSPLALSTWAEVLRKVPDSRLLISAPAGEPQRQLALFFAAEGIDVGRITAFTPCTHEQFWLLHGSIDIALDPFPFNGGMTTCESLWQGVPVITCDGAPNAGFSSRYASRVGRTLLKAIALEECAATGLEDYVNKAVVLASDKEKLAELRRGLRERMQASPLMDEHAFAIGVEEAYRNMWRGYCK